MSIIKTAEAVYFARLAIGQVVHLRIEPFDDRSPGMVTAIHVREGLVTYGVSWADPRQETVHQELELITDDEEGE